MHSSDRFRCFLDTALVAVIVATLASACSILPKRESVQIWQPPEGATATTVTRAQAGFSLRVDTPKVTNLLDRTDIVVMPTPGQVNLYQGARWSDAPALLVRRRLVDAFMAANLSAVTTDDDRFTADYTLSGDLRTFQSEYRSGAPVVVVRYDARLRHGASRHILASHSFVITQAPSGTQVPQIVAAFGAADDALAAQVVAWALMQARHARHPDAAATGASSPTGFRR